MSVRARIAVPWNRWIRQRQSNMEDQNRRKPHLDITSPLSLSTEPFPTMSYGATQNGDGSRSKGSTITPTRVDSLLSVPEEPECNDDGEQSSVDELEDEDEWELENLGLYRGSYSRLVVLYTAVPLSSLLAFALLASLQIVIYPLREFDPYPHPKYFPFPFPEILASASLWSLSHLLRVPLHSLFSCSASCTIPAVVLSTFFHALVHTLFRIAAFPILLLRHHMVHVYPTWQDPSFRRVWWIALGWSFAEIIVGVAQGYEHIALYRDVLVPPGKDVEFLSALYQQSPILSQEEPGHLTDSHLTMREANGKKPCVQESGIQAQNVKANMMSAQQRFRLDAIKSQVDRNLDHLIAFKGREELEEVYGIPAIKIPVFVSCLLRIDSIILSLGLSLLLSSSYLSSCISRSDSFIPHPPPEGDFETQLDSNRSFYITFPIVVTLYFLLSLLHSPLVLPHIGVHTVAYVGVLVGLGCLFAGLGMWEALL